MRTFKSAPKSAKKVLKLIKVPKKHFKKHFWQFSSYMIVHWHDAKKMVVTDHAKDDDNEDSTKLAKVHLSISTCCRTRARIAVLLHPPGCLQNQLKGGKKGVKWRWNERMGRQINLDKLTLTTSFSTSWEFLAPGASRPRQRWLECTASLVMGIIRCCWVRMIILNQVKKIKRLWH